MLKKILCSLALPAALAAYTTPAMAAPPQPIPQTLGIPDGVFNNLLEANCRSCHENPDIVNAGSIPDRHHNLVGRPIPDITVSHGGAETYECLSCHVLTWNGTTYVFSNFRDCLLCHVQQAGQASVHHLTAKAQQNQCQLCHSYIDTPPPNQHTAWPAGYVGFNDRTYDPSIVTPKPGQQAAQKQKGYCDYCHNAGIDPVHGTAVATNEETHHGIGIHIADPLKCDLCHDTTNGRVGTNWAIRQCEACHGVNSLHSIQADSNGDGIAVGGESAYYGHIGNQADCAGCHAGYLVASEGVDVTFAPGIPTINSLNPDSITAGSATLIKVSGSAFANADGPSDLTITLTNTKDNLTQTVLTPESVTGDSLFFQVPATMKPGNYRVTAMKNGMGGNGGAILAITPAVQIASASYANHIYIIRGSGFSQYLNAQESGTRLVLSDTGAECKVVSWTNTKIVAIGKRRAPQVTVHSVFGDATHNVK